MSRMDFDKIVQWKNEIDICNMLLRSQPDNDNIKAKLLLATDEYERHRNPKGYKKRNTFSTFIRSFVFCFYLLFGL